MKRFLFWLTALFFAQAYGESKGNGAGTELTPQFGAYHHSPLTHARGAARQMYGSGALRSPNVPPIHQGAHPSHWPSQPPVIINPVHYVPKWISSAYIPRPSDVSPLSRSGAIHKTSGGVYDPMEDADIVMNHPRPPELAPNIDIDPEESVEGCGGSCRGGEFLCSISCTCIPSSWRCDGEFDCVRGEDEATCSTIKQQVCSKDTHVRCPRTWKCINKDWLCDGDDDCGDFSDETHCEGVLMNCTNEEFECANGLCIPLSWLCDGDNDCRDYSDEMNCTQKMDCISEHEFRCSDGDCISLSWRCDSEPDCSDQSDEVMCPEVIVPECGPSEFPCAYPRCVRQEFRCDGDDDCGDWSDEDDCPEVVGGPCTEQEFRCESGKCISNKWKCDGEKDCEGGEDETGCEKASPRPCGSDEFACHTGTCIIEMWVCDGVQDCPQAEDEENCKELCDPMTQYTCPFVNISSPHPGTHCIRKKQVCDGIKDCLGGEDEKQCPKRKDCTKSSIPCQQLCIETYEGKDACTCKPGYILSEDDINCEDVDECSFKTDPVCSQTCNNTIGSYKCGCHRGYELRPDGTTCKARGSPPSLVFANRIDIRQVSLNSFKYTAILKGLHNAIALDYHYKKGLIFWTDISMDIISRSRINGTNITEIAKSGLDSPGGIAVDWIHDLLFWTDSGTRRVEVSNLDGQIRHVLISDDIQKPRAIAVHPGEALVFWTDWGPKPKIERCEMDGSNRIALITESIQWPNGMTIDYTINRIYWSDAKHHVIESCKFDGTERRKVVTKGLPHPFAVTLFEDAIYWTDWRTKSVSTASKATGTGFRTIHSGLLFPMDIHSYHPQRQPFYTNHCGNDSGGCSHLCLPNALSFQCICPLGLKLTKNNKTCDKTTDHMLLFARMKDIRLRSLVEGTPNYDVVIPVEGIKSARALTWDIRSNSIFWTDIETKTISSSKINGTEQRSIINKNLETPAGLAIDWVTNKLYWIDAGTLRVEVSNLDGTMRSLLIWDGIENPRDIVLDPLNAFMYWSDWGSPGRIEKAGMHGGNREIFLSLGNGSRPNGLSVDFQTSRLYWADSGTQTIEYADLNGKKAYKRVLLSDVPHPIGLTVFQDNIYWTDLTTNSIHKANKITGENSQIIRNGLSGLKDIIVMEHDMIQIVPKCEHNNGGCSHLCLIAPNKEGYVCACPVGIKLKEDNKTCHKAPDKWLIVAHRTEILQIALDEPYSVDVVLPLPQLTAAVAVDVDKENGEIYWSDTAEDVIQKANFDFGVATIVSDGLVMADGIVIDSVGRKLYWTDAGNNNIQVCALSDCEMLRKVLIWNHLENPRAITLNYDMGLLFWTDWGNQPKIEQSNMDGNNRVTLISEKLVWPNGLAVDKGRMYWTDAKLGVIESALLADTTNRTVILNQLLHPYALVILDEFMYWTDWHTNAIHRAYKNGTDQQYVVRHIKGPMDIKIVETNSKDKLTDVCQPNNGGCSHLCLRTPKNYSCACPTGITLMDDKKTCKPQPNGYLLIASDTTLSRISMDTKEMWLFSLPTPNIEKAMAVDFHWNLSTIFYVDFQLNSIKGVNMTALTQTWDIINNLSSPSSLAIDWIANNLYWVETGISKIVVSRIDGSFKKIIITRVDDPRCIALYPQKGYIFWTTIGLNPRIERSNLDGSYRKIIHGTELGIPNGLAIDYQLNKIFWSDSLNNKIEVSDLNGRNRMLLIPKTSHPIGLTLYGEHIIWADFHKKKVQMADAMTGRDQTALRGTISDVTGICAVTPERQQGHNPCAVENGYCTHLCLFRGKRGYICECPDITDSKCSTEPAQLVPITNEEELDDIDEEGLPEDSNFMGNSFSQIVLSLCMVLGTCIIIIIFSFSHIYLRRNRRAERKYIYNVGRSVLTFSNPNYNASATDIRNPTADKKPPFLWRKLRFEKSQERVFTVHGDSDKAGCAEVVSLIPVPHSPCPSPTPTSSITLEASTSNC
ncbi:low-density lipoprotein receptor-related protein 4 [Cimex lectularius]|uniref:EGF-like domain-containing protein n=1 Tax=Cimex lectularius TaxID=79782 RepID=A0A8I6S2Y6_CIMLE|nr:low-density lipoprotein receptor-related protein 4 [Cimex lectularius]